jgi:hypothetical protein
MIMRQRILPKIATPTVLPMDRKNVAEAVAIPICFCGAEFLHRYRICGKQQSPFQGQQKSCHQDLCGTGRTIHASEENRSDCDQN